MVWVSSLTVLVNKPELCDLVKIIKIYILLKHKCSARFSDVMILLTHEITLCYI